MIAYKFLRADRTTAFSQFQWSLDTWVEAPVVDPCRSGIHACRAGDLPFWVGPTLFEIELDGPVVEESTKVVARRGRLVRRIAAWEEGVAEAYTRWCADRGHEIAAGDSRLDPWDAGIEESVPDGPAMLGFMAAAIAEERGGVDAYRAERARQAEWLAARLRLV